VIGCSEGVRLELKGHRSVKEERRCSGREESWISSHVIPGRDRIIDLDALDIPSHDLSELDAPFSKKEVWDTIVSLPLIRHLDLMVLLGDSIESVGT
jgi:hypothetical protein